MPSEKNKPLKDIPADKFMEKIDLWQGPKVTIHVGGKSYPLSKKLVCYYSTFFDRAFNGSFKEGVEQTIKLEETSAETFETIVQYMYTSHVVIPTTPITKVEDGEKEEKISATHITQEKITRLLNFIALADRIDLLGPFDSVIDDLKSTIEKSKMAVTGDHVRTAMKLPTGHAVRSVIIKCCAWDFLAKRVAYTKTKKSFRFEAEMEELDVFAAELIRELNKSFWHISLYTPKVSKEFVGLQVPDPLKAEGNIRLL